MCRLDSTFFPFFNVESLLNLPTPVKAVIALLMGTSLLGAVAMIDPKLVVIVAVGMVILAGALIAYHFVLKWTAARKSKALAGSIAQHGAAAPNAISNPNSRAKLDAMKRSFEVGMEKFATSGKDVYSMPWYVVVGEPGAGKTEAIRHCNVGFPPGLQDEMQGVGGTINMNWWFTNRAVLLDTAGRLMFEEVAPGETHEWPEFLKLLRRNRPNCPINGLLLVIPCDSLIKDSEAEIGRKAGKIAQQLDLIQRTLDLRFPVFVLITKSDLLDGFREFFDDMDPDSQHQMVGWSNPQPRDVAFQPELVDQHIQTVVARIRKRRLGLLKDPIPQHGAARRTDEVDALFSLPESFTLAAPRLRSYLEKVFVAGPWSAKPLFLRGIYFTSAMREGAALDLVLAQAIGVSVDALPEGKAWERERAYFLRDLFTEKIFRESGIVTRATNTKTLIRSRQIALYGAGFAALVAILVFTFLSYRQFQQSIGEQSKLWSFARQGWKNGEWNPLVSPVSGAEPGGKYQYNGDTAIDPASGASTLAGYHSKLRDISSKEIPVGFVFAPLAHFFHLEGDRKRAQRVVFEGSVVKPLLDGDRARMLAPASSPAAGKAPELAAVNEANAVAALLRVEADALSKSGAATAPDTILKPGMTYATGTDPSATKSFPSVSEDFLWTYTKNNAGTWPPAWLPKGSGSLDENKPIKAGLDRLFADASASLAGSETSLGAIKGLRDDLREFRLREGKLNDLAKTDDRRDLDTKMHGRLEELKVTKAAIDGKLKAARGSGLLKEYSLGKEYHDLVDQSKVQSDAAFKIVHDAAANAAGAGPNAKLFPEVIALLDRKHDEMVARVSNSFNKDEVTELTDLDDLLKDFGDGRRFYEVRVKQYQDAETELAKDDGAGNLLGRDWSPLVELRERVDKARAESKTTQEKLGGKFDACTYFYDRALEKRTGAIAARYLTQTRDSFSSIFSFPLVKGDNRRMSRPQLAEAGTLLAMWQKDLKGDNMKLVPSAVSQKLKAFQTDTEKLGSAVDGVEANVTIELVNYNESPDKSGLDRLRKVVVEGSEHDTSTSSNIEIGSGSVFNSYRMTFLDYTSGAQQSYSVGVDGYDLATRTHGNGKLKVTVPGIGLPIYLSVKADRPIPDMNSLPAKQKILGDLN